MDPRKSIRQAVTNVDGLGGAASGYSSPRQIEDHLGAPGEPLCPKTQRRNMSHYLLTMYQPFGGPAAENLDAIMADVCVIRDMSKLKLLSVFPSVYLGKHLGIREVDYFPAAQVRVETERPLDVYADGEYVCRTPVEVGVVRHAFQVICP